MAQGTNFDTFFLSSAGGSGFARGCIFGTPDIPGSNGGIVHAILTSNGISFNNCIAGSNLPGYDIKAQDCISMIRLSLLAASFGSQQAIGNFYEMYSDQFGNATTVEVGKQYGATNSLQKCFLTNIIGEALSKVDHVIVKGKANLPIRKFGDSINVMGNGYAVSFQFDCGVGVPTLKNRGLAQEAWAEFETSPQCEDMQRRLKNLVHRSNWEQLVTYKIAFNGIPPWATFSPSQTVPRVAYFEANSQFVSSNPVHFGPMEPCSGGVVDIGGVSIVGIQVLDIVKGSELLSSVAPYLSQITDYTFTENDYFVLLGNRCTITNTSRGENWFLVNTTGNMTDGEIWTEATTSNHELDQVLNGHRFGTTVNWFRSNKPEVSNFSSLVSYDITNYGQPYATFSQGYSKNPFHGPIILGAGSELGIEGLQGVISYTLQKPSIQIHSPKGDAPEIATNVAAGGIIYTPIIYIEKPAGTGLDGELIEQVAPPDEEGTPYQVDTELDNLSGSVVDLSAPFLSAEGAAGFSGYLKNIINNGGGTYKTYSYAYGGYGILPGMLFDGDVINSIEFTYTDKDQVSTNITTGPKYYPVGSWGDSQYIKRSESITKSGRIVAANNAQGVFVVNVDGQGVFEAISSIDQPLYPGDKVEVNIQNVPVEI